MKDKKKKKKKKRNKFSPGFELGLHNLKSTALTTRLSFAYRIRGFKNRRIS